MSGQKNSWVRSGGAVTTTPSYENMPQTWYLSKNIWKALLFRTIMKKG